MIIMLMLFSAPVLSDVYKCKVANKKVYQQTPCRESGAKVDLGTDISIEKQRASAAELKQDMRAYNHKKQVKKEQWDKERLIRAEEDKADAAHRNANANRAQVYQQARQVNALRVRNDIAAKKLNELRPGTSIEASKVIIRK